MKRIAMAAATAMLVSAGVVGCGGGGGDSGDASTPAKKAPAKLEPGRHHAVGRLHRSASWA